MPRNPVDAADAPEVRTLVFVELLDGETLFETLSPRPAQEILAGHDRLVRDLLVRFAGREVEKSRRFLLLFDRPLDAVAFCLSYHEAVKKLAVEEGCPLQGRAAIHVGEVLLWENPAEHVAHGARRLELEGPSRTLAARLLSLARGGQTLLTRTAYDLARRAAVGGAVLGSDVAWRSYGPYRFPRSGQAIDLFEVGREETAPLEAPVPDGESRSGVPLVGGRWRPEAGQPIPQRSHWILDRRLEGATFGEAWLARHQKTSETRAFRFCLDPAELPCMRRHLAVLRRLREQLGDPGFTIRPMEAHLDEEPYFLESEHAAGSPLPLWAADRGGLAHVPLAIRLDLVAQLADALGILHSLGIALGDLDPSHLLVLEQSGQPPRLLFAELSQCHVPGEEMASEPVRDGAGSSTADFQALGVFLYQILTGDLSRQPGPFWERDIEEGLLRADVAALLEPLPERRLSDAIELARRLRDLEVRRAEEGRRKELPPRGRGERRLASAVILAVATLLALAFVLGRLTAPGL